MSSDTFTEHMQSFDLNELGCFFMNSFDFLDAFRCGVALRTASKIALFSTNVESFL
jgi:hypothetical protein